MWEFIGEDIVWFVGNRTTANCSIIFFLLQSSNVPESLPGNNTWNCSVPHWSSFQRHFLCNLRQECANGEDEAQCPYAPCDRGGISFAGQCYFLVTDDTDITWKKAQTLCRNAGAYIVSLASPREWSDVMTWLHLAVPWLERRMYIITYLGLASPPSTLPSM